MPLRGQTMNKQGRALVAARDAENSEELQEAKEAVVRLQVTAIRPNLFYSLLVDDIVSSKLVVSLAHARRSPHRTAHNSSAHG